MSVSNVSAASTVTYTQANQIASICFQGYNGGTRGPISITQGVYQDGRSTKIVYLVALSGTELVTNQSTGLLTDLKVGFNQNNPYLQNVVRIISQNVPRNSNLILTGHSLGGMVAQQVAGSYTIKSNYNVMNTVTFGSPLISEGSRAGVVRRLGDTSDVVPYLSATGNLVWQVAGLNREDGGYGANALAAHNESYLRGDVWGAYDITGTKYGGARLTLYQGTQRFFKSPTK